MHSDRPKSMGLRFQKTNREAGGMGGDCSRRGVPMARGDAQDTRGDPQNVRGDPDEASCAAPNAYAIRKRRASTMKPSPPPILARNSRPTSPSRNWAARLDPFHPSG